MNEPRDASDPLIGREAAFVTTHWSVVLAARELTSAQAEAALAKLCATYWYPLYAFVRRRGYSPHDAEDLTQEFFARLIGKEYLGQLQREGGKFRSFLLTALKHFLANEWNRAQARKRGGAVKVVSWDELEAERRYALEPADPSAPEAMFEQGWALTVLKAVMNRLHAEYAAAGRGGLFEQLQPAVAGGRGAVSHAELAARLGLNEGAVRVAVHRLRRRYGELLREEIAHTVADPAEVDAEIRYLITAACG